MEKDKERTQLYGRDKGLLDYLRKPYDRFLKIKGDPREIALGMALGLFVGMSPFMGIQMAVAVFLAAIFKWNKNFSCHRRLDIQPSDRPLYLSADISGRIETLWLSKALQASRGIQF